MSDMRDKGDKGDEAASYARKVRRAAQMVLLQRHKRPGAKGWELKRTLGKQYMKVVELLNDELGKLGLEIKVLPEEGDVEPLTEEQRERASFFATLRDPAGTMEATAGLRVDDIAMLAAIVAYITSKHGRAQTKEVDQLLAGKFPRWRIEFGIQRFIRRGYLREDEEGILRLDWRSMVEIDQKSLLSLMLGVEGAKRE